MRSRACQERIDDGVALVTNVSKPTVIEGAIGNIGLNDESPDHIVRPVEERHDSCHFWPTLQHICPFQYIPGLGIRVRLSRSQHYRIDLVLFFQRYQRLNVTNHPVIVGLEENTFFNKSFMK